MSESREAARRELALIRRDAMQPWRLWPRRVGEAIAAAVRAVGEFLKDLVLEAVGELFLATVSFGLLAVVVTLVTWGWGRSPAATVGLLAGIAGFLAYGGYELFGRTTRRRGRLAATAAGATVFTALWATYLATYYVG
ncbi:hypothetical protein [Kutzneria buriramensis]|uniref:Uncharacterized protein n=1 Tax=Kutzneria buriramensis TaxID=1045776 RepID=A0A3E0I0L2_9PSEU|nr:hypothetical protein [Kutzneria buriramensis]REH51745.1 hypothetical protein BCF44_103194 [Kutzneria buriramensis]